MKKLVVFAVFALMLSFSSLAQKKIGYINSSELLLLMPERKEAETTLQKEALALEDQLKSMMQEYQAKKAEYDQKSKEWSDLLRDTKYKELQRMEQGIQDFQLSAQEELQKREAELLEPILNKAREAVKVVADKNGYSHVFDSSSGVVIHAPEGDNLLPLVKKDLGLASE